MCSTISELTALTEEDLQYDKGLDPASDFRGAVGKDSD